MRNIRIVFLILLATIMWASISNAQYAPNSKLDFRFASDPWTGEDKLDHLTGGMATTFLTTFVVAALNDMNSDLSNKQARDIALWNAAFWTLWEVKDALVPYEEYGKIGGDGFSHKDLVWSLAGVTIATLFILAIQ